jgi:hypothetical protein
LIGGDILHFARTFLPARLKLTSEGGNETDAPPRRCSLTLASQQKSFLCFSFVRAGLDFLNFKSEHFSASAGLREAQGAGLQKDI